jgi:hypothetical protein
MKPTLGWTMPSREEMRQVERSLANSEQDTRDEIGFPLIHQGFADRFFPGTKPLQTDMLLFGSWREYKRGNKRMDLNKIGLAVGVLALMLAIPLAVVANLLTPRVREWYSTTSSKRLKQRIAELEEKLGQSEQEWTFTQGEWAVFSQGFVAGSSILTSIALLCTFLGLAIAATIKTLIHVVHGKIDIILLLLLALNGYSTSMFFAIRLLTRRSRAWELHTTMGRDYLSHEVERLRAILTAKD